MNSSLVMRPFSLPFFKTRREVVLSMVKRKWIFERGVSTITMRGEEFLMIRASSKSISWVQKASQEFYRSSYS